MDLVWHIGRVASQQAVNRGVLLVALRQKYGKEIGAFDATGGASKSDGQIHTMWWLYDEQGHPVSTAPKSVGNSPYGCGDGGETFANSLTAFCQPASPICATSVGVTVILQVGEILDHYSVIAFDAPLSVRAQKLTEAWLQEQAEKVRQRELERSKANNPLAVITQGLSLYRSTPGRS